MALDPIQIEQVQTIIIHPSYAATETLLSALNAAQEAATVADIAKFVKVQDSFTELKGELNTDNTAKRLSIRNRVRTRLGLSWLTSETDLAYGGANSGSIEYSHPSEIDNCCNYWK